MNPNAQRQNAVFRTIQAKAPNSIIQPGAFLRSEVLLQSGQSRYAFNLGKNVGNPRATERRLDQNDAFIATHIALMLLAENPATPGVGVLQTFPNPVAFVAEANNVNPAHLENIYNGSLSIKVDDKVYSDGLLLAPCRVVNTTQQRAGATADGANAYSEKKGWDGFIELSPTITFDGSRKNEVYLDIPVWNGQQAQYVTAATRIYAVLIQYGYLATGASNVGQLSEM